MSHYWYRAIIYFVSRIILGWCGGLKVEGRENVPLKGGVMIVPNHISDSDPIIIGMAAPRYFWAMAKEELFAIPILGRIVKGLRGFPVKRYSPDLGALRFAEQLLRKGEAVVVFPEGKLSETGKLMPYLPGAILVSRRAGTPLIPTVILRSNRVMPFGHLIPHRIGVPVIVRFGKPISAEELIGDGRGGDGMRRAAERLHQIALELQGNDAAPATCDEAMQSTH